MKVLVAGDRFIPGGTFAEEIEARLPGTPVTVADWAGEKATQHEAQQRMEVHGAAAVPAPPELLAAVPGAEVLCVHFAPVGPDLLAAADGLRLVAVARTGLENVDLDAASARGIGVVPVFGRNASAVAELQIGLILAESRNIARADASVKNGGWRKEFPGRRVELGGSTVGMIGFGQVGRHFARKLSGFGCTLLAYDPYAPDEALAESGVRRASTVDDLLPGADFVVVQARHSAETDRFIGARELALLKPGAYFVNVARSRVVDTAALYTALAEGRIAGAGLDVFDEEPLAEDSPWRRLDNVTLTTHFGGDTEQTNRTSAALVAEAVAEFTETGRVRTAANAALLGWS
ncbi:NAD(P)-dependent oxidoreductase [Crossiella sp. CA-258035]|uniref:NAD(P)-dependent oxidoreductase n=1 Tax=Crossiella sp. CA-258035 TaxID=2981138 RepID=UPI0024BC1E67|nr:NAD(P)-dependent oxidoreductase [Crossiella sp. CA-258035]WHT19077.1 NAD(P)-dependent oxidoreductase [Crossiella sp. CA-258035]